MFLFSLFSRRFDWLMFYFGYYGGNDGYTKGYDILTAYSHDIIFGPGRRKISWVSNKTNQGAKDSQDRDRLKKLTFLPIF